MGTFCSGNNSLQLKLEEETDSGVGARCRVKYVADLDCCISEQSSCWALPSNKLVLKLDSIKPKVLSLTLCSEFFTGWCNFLF